MLGINNLKQLCGMPFVLGPYKLGQNLTNKNNLVLWEVIKHLVTIFYQERSISETFVEYTEPVSISCYEQVSRSRWLKKGNILKLYKE